MKKSVIIGIIICIVAVCIIYFFTCLNRDYNVVITKFESNGITKVYYELKEGISSEEYSDLYLELREKCLNISNEECTKIFNGVDFRYCVIYTNKDTLQLPASCPGQVFPKGSHICNAQSVPSYRGENELGLTLISLEGVEFIEVCCADYKVDDSDVNLKKSDFECSKPYKIS